MPNERLRVPNERRRVPDERLRVVVIGPAMFAAPVRPPHGTMTDTIGRRSAAEE